MKYCLKVSAISILFPFIVHFASYSQQLTSKSLLWEISGGGLNTKSYLYGTFHVQDKRVFAFGDSLMICFNQCSRYAGEIIFDKKSMKETQSRILFPKNQSLKKSIGKSYYKRIKAHLKNNKMGVYNLIINRIKPIFVAGIITQAGEPKDSAQVLDAYFQKEAKKKNMVVTGLESVAEQLNALDKIPLEKQITMLKQCIDSISITKPNEDNGYKALLKLYLEQDIDELQKITTENEDLTNTELIDYVLLDRNKIMASRIIGQIKIAPTFIGIGAAHLAGEQGVINLLIAEGYNLRAVNSPFIKN